MSESFAELLDSSDIAAKMQAGAIIRAQVIDLQDRCVVLNAGLKSEGFVPIDQFRDANGELEVAIGDEVEVILDAVEDGRGRTRLSREKLKRVRTWQRLEEAHTNDSIVTGSIVERVRGGFIVNLDDVRAFLPGSLVDVRPVRDISHLEGKPLDLKIIKMEKHGRNVVVSRRAVMEHGSDAERDALYETLSEGAVIKGVVKNMTDYGAFIDLGGVDGLLHITDMAWKRIKVPSEVVQLNDEIEVKVLKFDRERNRVSLGLKQMGEDPWDNIDTNYTVGQNLTGSVTNIAHYGCFVEIADGIEGLVHVSEMDWVRKNVNPTKLFHIGQEVNVMVLEVDKERRRVSLGYKQCTENPWQLFEKNHQIGSKLTGTVRSITDFGIFVGLDEGVDGLVHVSDLSWSEDPGILRNYEKGAVVETVVLRVDEKRERISLGMKQLQDDPLSNYIDAHPLGSSVTGVVKRVEEDSVLFELAPDVEITMPASRLSADEQVSDARQHAKEGQTIELKIIVANPKERGLQVSARDEQSEQQQAAIAVQMTNDQKPTTRLGDLFRDKLDPK